MCRNLRALGSAENQRPHVRRPLREAFVRDLADGEAVRLDRRERVSVAVAAARELLLDTVQPILPLGRLRVVRADVLEEEQPAAGLEDAVSLLQRAGGVRDRAENECR